MAKDKAASPKLQLTLPEYNRIYEIIYSVLEGRLGLNFQAQHLVRILPSLRPGLLRVFSIPVFLSVGH